MASSRPPSRHATDPQRAAERALDRLIAADWEWRLRESPVLATSVGDPRYDDRWSDLSFEAIDRRAATLKDRLRRLEGIDRRLLGPKARLNLDLFLHEIRLAVEGLAFKDDLMPLTQMNGVHQDVADLLQIAPRRTVAECERIVLRLRRVGLLVDQTMALMRAGAQQGLTPPRVILRTIPELIANQAVAQPEASPIGRMLIEDLPADIGEPARRRLRAAILRAVGDVVVPAYRRLATFMEEEYLPRARTTLGISALPEGAAWYAHLIRLMTSCDRSARDIHQTGQDEVKRIRSAMLTTMRTSGFAGTLPEFFHFLRTEKRFFFSDRDRLLITYRDICKRIDAALPRLFRTLPRLPYGVVPVPAYSEKVQTTAYYHPGSIEAGRPGYFFANTYDLAARPTWEMEALAAHEAVPGHHLQISLAQELSDLPAFRRHGHQTAFVEGWGLYSESLGAELGLYRDPHSDFGRLTYEMWRAIRLVIDTGLHAFGWTRERAIAFFETNAGKAGHDITNEVDRYIAWPAQALAYKMGEMSIQALRRSAQRELRSRFDIRAFHDAVLLAGPLPLPILDRRVRAWIRSRSKARGTGA